MEVSPRGPTEQCDQRCLGELGDLTDRGEPKGTELRRRHRPDTPEPLDRERMKEGELAVGRHHEQTVRFGHPTRHLRKEFRPRYSDRDR
jgi:hypothetical protein